MLVYQRIRSAHLEHQFALERLRWLARQCDIEHVNARGGSYPRDIPDCAWINGAGLDNRCARSSYRDHSGATEEHLSDSRRIWQG